jgi:hypothetical protein
VATQAELDNWYAYHDSSDEQGTAYAALRAKTKELAQLFESCAPACADTTAAHRHLRETLMAMNLAIACNT